MKKAIALILVLTMVFSISSSAFAAADPNFSALKKQWTAINKSLGDSMALWDDYADRFEFVEDLPENSTDDTSTNYDYAVMRISKGYLEDSEEYCSWEDNECPYYVVLRGFYGMWFLVGIVYLEGQVFNFVGKNGSFYFDKTKCTVFWSE